ncbi:MAG: hypothetical protein HC819_11125 [Cyclobacteriaceae bacterium]|nr:hypothetical protein [Cyclobacteriaceae bacterium]
MVAGNMIIGGIQQAQFMSFDKHSDKIMSPLNFLFLLYAMADMLSIDCDPFIVNADIYGGDRTFGHSFNVYKLNHALIPCSIERPQKCTKPKKDV